MLWSKLLHVDEWAPGVQRRCENDTSTFVHSYNILLYILISIWCKHLVHPCCSSMIQCNRVMLCWFYTIYNTNFTQEFPCIPYVSILSSVHFIIICVMHLCMYHCPACRTTFIATRFRVAVICPIIPVPHCIRVFFYFVWFVFINHIFQFYYELCTYCNILDIYLS